MNTQPRRKARHGPFGAGAVSQEYTLSSVLARDYHLNSYDLSAPAIGPWGEYVNLWAEGDRLKTREGATLVFKVELLGIGGP